MAEQRSMSDKVAELGQLYRQSLIENMARALGDRPMRASTISHQRELEMYIMPTSPAAVQAFEMGATLAEAEQANRMWAAQMQAEGATDEQVFGTCRRFAHQLGKSRGQNDPTKEVAYHKRMAERAARYRAGLGGGVSEIDGEEGPADGGSTDRPIYQGEA